jgi:hypothetical protein
MIILLALAPISWLFYFMDRHWYHRLLQGSVKQAGAIEKEYAAFLPEIQLGAKISAASPVEWPSWIWKYVFFFVREENFRKHSRIHSDAKIEILYKSVIYGAGSVAIAFALVRGVEFHQQPPLYWMFEVFKLAVPWLLLG